jgi:hypothetical protein
VSLWARVVCAVFHRGQWKVVQHKCWPHPVTGAYIYWDEEVCARCGRVK